MKIIFSILIITVTILQSLPAGENELNRKVYKVGEILTYKVSWSIFRLGTIKVQTILDENYDEKTHIKLIMHVVSNPYLPFISIDEFNESLIKISDGMSRSFFAKHRNNNDRIEIHSVYNSTNQKIFFTIVDYSNSQPIKRDTLENIPLYVEGPSLFFISRALIQNEKEYNIPTMIRGKIANTYLNFKKNIQIIESDLFSHPIRTRYFEGKAEWEGGTSAGLSGNFSGWLSDDSAAIPIISEMKVLLGTIKLELEHIERPNWKPPLINSQMVKNCKDSKREENL